MSRKTIAVILGVVSLVYVPAVALAASAALMSPMMFDAPGSENMWGLWIAFWGVIALPFSLLGSLLAMWVLFARRREKAALWVTALPIVDVLVVAGGLFLVQ